MQQGVYNNMSNIVNGNLFTSSMTNLDWTLRLRLPAGYNNSISIKPYTYNSNLPLPPASSSSSGVAWPRGSSLSPSRLARALLRDIPLETVDVVHCRFRGLQKETIVFISKAPGYAVKMCQLSRPPCFYGVHWVVGGELLRNNQN